MTDKNIVSMMHAAMKGDTLAANQVNDIFEENGLDKIKFPRLCIVYDQYYNKIEGAAILTKICLANDILNTYKYIEEANEDNLADYYGIGAVNDNSIVYWLEKANKWYNTCADHGIEIDKIPTPSRWGFSKKDMEVPGMIEFFEKICTEPKENWY